MPALALYDVPQLYDLTVAPGSRARTSTARSGARRRARAQAGLQPKAIRAREKAGYDPVAQIRTSTWRMRRDGLPACALSPIRLRQIFPQELLLLESVGLRLAARYGDFERGPFTGDSLNQIFIARPAGRDSA